MFELVYATEVNSESFSKKAFSKETTDVLWGNGSNHDDVLSISEILDAFGIPYNKEEVPEIDYNVYEFGRLCEFTPVPPDRIGIAFLIDEEWQKRNDAENGTGFVNYI